MDNPPMSVKTSGIACDAQASTELNIVPNQKRKPSVLIVVDRTHLCTKGVPPIKTRLLVTKRKQDIKYSAVAKDNPNCSTQTTVSAINRFVLFAEVLSKIRSTFNTMSYSDKIIVVSISISRIFGDKIEGQKVHDRIKNANNIFTNVPMRQISTNSHQ